MTFSIDNRHKTSYNSIVNKTWQQHSDRVYKL